MNRRTFLASVAGGVGAFCGLGTRPALAYDDAHRIRKTAGWTIDNDFGRVERQILTDALGHFYARFLQPYAPGDYGGDRVWRARDWSNAFSDVTARHIGHYVDGFGERKIFGADWTDMWRHFVDAGKPFPPVTLKFVSVERAGFVAQAHYDMILINSFPNDVAYQATNRDDNVKSRGEFEIEINDWYLGNRAEGRHYVDPVYYAGVIAHEAWHNLGHGHPLRRSDANYYQHQIVLHEMCIMRNSSIRYGDEAGTPVYCRRHPG
jgi:hypothetical protein